MTKDPFVPGNFYHIFNRANSQQDKLFYQDRNYQFFLVKWHHYLASVFAVWSYCLIPNHFHFLVQVTDGDNTSITEKCVDSPSVIPRQLTNRSIEEEACFRNILNALE